MDISTLKSKNFKIFIDTSSLLHPQFEEYIRSIAPNLKKRKTGIIIIDAVKSELQGHLKNKYNSDLLNRTSNAVKLLEWGKQENIFTDFPETTGYADNVFQTVFTRFRNKYNLCLITQDNALTEEIIDLNTSDAVDYIKSIRVYKMIKSGDMSQVTLRKDISKIVEDVQLDEAKPFKKSRTPIDSSFYEPIPISKVPKKGDIVISERGLKLKLLNRINRGGEGSIYEFKTVDYRKSPEASAKQYLAKIYHEGSVNKAKIEKIKLMISNKGLNIKGVCFPISLLYNENKEAIGYTMRRAGNSTSQEALPLKPYLFVKPLAKETFKNWNRFNLITLCINIINTINVLHRYNIVIGDINPSNILIDKNANVYFIDTDSFQVEKYPCPVGQATFTHPDVLRQNYTTYLRTQDHERFAVATLIFMILLPGLGPYQNRGGTTPLANVKKRLFVFPYSDFNTNIQHIRPDKVSEGQWRYIWSHLPHRIKEAFYETFHKGEMRAINDSIEYNLNPETNIKQISSSKMGWANLLNNYLRLLENGFSENEIYPNEYKLVATIKLDSESYSNLLQQNQLAKIAIEKRTNCHISLRGREKRIIISGASKDKDGFNLAKKLVENIESEREKLIEEIDGLHILKMEDIYPDFLSKARLDFNTNEGPIKLFQLAAKLKVDDRELIHFLEAEGVYTSSITPLNKKTKNLIKRKFTRFTNAGIKLNIEAHLNGFISRYKDEVKDLKIEIYEDTIFVISEDKNCKKIAKDFSKYCQSIYQKFDISSHSSHMIRDFIGKNGKNLERIDHNCKLIGIKDNPALNNKSYLDMRIVSIDVSKGVVFVFSANESVQEYVFNEIQKLELDSLWPNRRKINVHKKAIHNTINLNFFKAINKKHRLTRSDYFVSRNIFDDMLTSRKAFITLYTGSRKIEKKIFNEINGVNNWKYHTNVEIPLEIAQYLSFKNKNTDSLMKKGNIQTLRVSKMNPLETSVRIDQNKTRSWKKKHSAIGEFIIRGKFKKDVERISKVIISEIKKINKELNN